MLRPYENMIFKFIRSYYKHKESMKVETFRNITMTRGEFETVITPELIIFIEDVQQMKFYKTNITAYIDRLLVIAKHDLRIMIDPDNVANRATLSMWYYITTQVSNIRSSMTYTGISLPYAELSSNDKAWYERRVLDCLSDYYIDGMQLEHSDIIENLGHRITYGK